MPKIRIHQLAKELDMTNDKIIEYLAKRGINVKSSFEALDEDTVEQLRRIVRREAEKVKARLKTKSTKDDQPETTPVKKEVKKVEATKEEVLVEEVEEEPEIERPIVEIPEGATVKEIAESINKNPNDLIKTLMKLGEMVTINQNVSREAIDVLEDELETTFKTVSADLEEEEVIVEDESLLQRRPPVVTVMGHVDHGKTLLLDSIRNTDVISGEAGGITQHIGAYQVDHAGKSITFIDTPGHEAFTAMRARGARVTDIAVLVVAADDGVMPQTIEAIDHAKDANVPILIAINKIDKSGADPEKIKQELTEYELVPEAWGGDTIYVEVSAKTKKNIDELLDMILLMVEMRELQANPDAPGRGVTIEANLDKGRGPVATVLVQRGTIRVGDPVVIGTAYGRTRALINDRGQKVEEAKPGNPVEIIGLSAVPSAGDTFKVVEDDKAARRIAEERALKKRQLEQMRGHVGRDDLGCNPVQRGAKLVDENTLWTGGHGLSQSESIHLSVGKLIALTQKHKGVIQASQR